MGDPEYHLGDRIRLDHCADPDPGPHHDSARHERTDTQAGQPRDPMVYKGARPNLERFNRAPSGSVTRYRVLPAKPCHAGPSTVKHCHALPRHA